MDDEQHKSECFERFRNAFNAIRAGNKSAASDYLRDLEAKHGRELAERVRDNLIACLKSEAWCSVDNKKGR